MSRLAKLKACENLSDLARLIGYKPRSLGYLIHQIDDGAKYTEFEIPKKSGGTRKISAPIVKLKAVQVRLADLLYDCVDEINRENGVKSHVSHGFRRGSSIFTNADQHTGKKYVFNIDLDEFFPSINFGRVKGFFEKNNHFKLKSPVAIAIAQLCCNKGILPQGSPTSPVISNLIGHILDMRLVKLAEHFGCTYTRYADDITFSTNKRKFPRALAKPKLFDSDDWSVGKELRRTVERSGFSINVKKTRMQYHYSRQVVTGLTVNKKPNVDKIYYKKVRAMCDRLFQTGRAHDIVELKDADGKIKKDENPVTIASLFGRMDHVFHAKMFGKQPPSFADYSNPSGFLEVYQNLVFFDFCVQNAKPTIICEGRTDVVYLKHALKSLHKDYPALISKEAGGFVFKVRFVHHYKRRARALGIFDGADNLVNFVHKFKKLSSKMRAPRTAYNTILLTDNDSGVIGSKKLFGTVARETGSECDGMKPSYPIVPGLHLVPVPKVKDTDEVSIETLFDNSLLQQKVNGKSFNYLTKVDSTKEYDKAYFADKIVKPNYKKINFDGFRPLLDAITGTIA